MRNRNDFKSKKEQGDWGEKKLSELVHTHQAQAVLVSSRLLRKREAGQIDLARISEKSQVLEIFEAKGSNIISFGQKKRLQKSAQFLSMVTGLQVRLVYALSLKEYFAKKSTVI